MLDLQQVTRMILASYGLEWVHFSDVEVNDQDGNLIETYRIQSIWIAILTTEPPYRVVSSIINTTNGVRGVVRTIPYRQSSQDFNPQPIIPYVTLPNDADSVGQALSVVNVFPLEPISLALDDIPNYHFQLYIHTPSVEMELKHYFGPLVMEQSMHKVWKELLKTTRRICEQDAARSETRDILDSWTGWGWIREI